MALGAEGIITIKGKALTTKVSQAWALSKSGKAWKKANIAGSVIKVNSKTLRADLGDGFTAEVKKSATPVAGDDDRVRRDSCCSSGLASSSPSAAQPGADVKHGLETLASQASDSPTKGAEGREGRGQDARRDVLHLRAAGLLLLQELLGCHQ